MTLAPIGGLPTAAQAPSGAWNRWRPPGRGAGVGRILGEHRGQQGHLGPKGLWGEGWFIFSVFDFILAEFLGNAR